MKSKLLWYAKQLIPIHYTTKYSDNNGNNFVCNWKMFFGKCYNVEHRKI